MISLRLLIVEDHRLTNECLRVGLGQYKEFTAMAQAYNGYQALKLAESFQPDVILMDHHMPEMNGIDATRQIKATYPHVRIMMISARAGRDEVLAALQAQADAYCTKDYPLEQLKDAILLVSQGAVWVDPQLAGYVVHEMLHNTASPTPSSSFATSVPAAITPSVPSKPMPVTSAGRVSSPLATSRNQASSQGKTALPEMRLNFETSNNTPSTPFPTLKPGRYEAGEVVGLQLNDSGNYGPYMPSEGLSLELPPTVSLCDALTMREIQLLECIAENLTNEEISHRLQLKPQWIAGYLDGILGKLGVSSELEAVERALKEGVITHAPILRHVLRGAP